jgi:hypothetical protein
MKPSFVVALIAFSSLMFTQCKKECDPPAPTPPPPNYEDSLKRGLWAYFDFNNSNFNDLSGKNHNMAGFNGAKFGIDTWGNENNTLQLDGADDYALIDSGKVFPDGNFTVSLLMMPANTYGRVFQKANPADAKGASMGLGYDDAGQNVLVFNVTKDNNICTTLTDLSNSTPLFLTKKTFANAWYYVVFQYINGTQKVYINGTLAGSQTNTTTSFKNCPNAPFYFGRWWNNDVHAFGGKIDELRIHTRALTEEEIKFLYSKR